MGSFFLNIANAIFNVIAGAVTKREYGTDTFGGDDTKRVAAPPDTAKEK